MSVAVLMHFYVFVWCGFSITDSAEIIYFNAIHFHANKLQNKLELIQETWMIVNDNIVMII